MLTIKDLEWASNLTLQQVKDAFYDTGINTRKMTAVKFLGFNPGGSFKYELQGGDPLGHPVYRMNLAFRKIDSVPAKGIKNPRAPKRGAYELYVKI